ncbi:MAG: tetratricopeptide repeat protein [Acidobacteriota bacterium]
MVALAVGFTAGWGAGLVHRWLNRDEADINKDFARLYAGGIAHHIAGRIDEAIDQLTRAARLRTDVVGLYLILGDLYRQKGLLDRAIRVHSRLLGRQDLTRAERAQVQASLGADFKTAGLVDRAHQAYRLALDLDAHNIQALRSMSRFSIEERDWEQALELEERLIRLDSSRRNRPLAFIYNEIGREHMMQGNGHLAHRNFQKAIAVDERTYPAHVFLGDEYFKRGKLKRAVAQWERVVDLEPRLLHLVFDRLEGAYNELGRQTALADLCRRIAERDEGDWRARVLLARIEAGRGDEQAAYHHLLDAAGIFPQSLTIQQELWRMTLERGLNRDKVRSYLDIIKGISDFADPFVCAKCAYRSLDYLWRCPRCYEWDTFSDPMPADRVRARPPDSRP